MRSFKYSPTFDKIIKKLVKKDRNRSEQVAKKMDEILSCDDPNHYKNLRYDESDKKEVHIGHYVLIFRLEGETIQFIDYDHHDVILRRKK